MKIILDAQLSPKITDWLRAQFNLDVTHVRDLGLMSADDMEIFSTAKKHSAILISKDSDFVAMVERLGTPPKLIWITAGNTTNQALKNIFSHRLKPALELLESGAAIVELYE